MFLAKDHAAFATDRRRLAIRVDIRHLQCGYAQKREYRSLEQHGRNPAEEVVGPFYIEVIRNCELNVGLGGPLVPFVNETASFIIGTLTVRIA
jgi:hypothetical protein